MESPANAIVPGATESVRKAILAALREEPDMDDGWAAAALREGVDADADADQ